MSNLFQALKGQKSVVVVFVMWLLVAIITPLLGIYEKDPFQILPSVAFLLPSIIFLIWYSRSAKFHQFVLSLDVRKVTWLQIVRIPAAILFCYSYAQRHLPGSFLIPAIVGDIVIGGTTPWAVSWLSKTPFPKRAFIGWHILGILEFIMDLVLRILNSDVPWGILKGEITSKAFNVLPYSIFPTFLAPFAVILHLIGVISARKIGEAARGSTSA